MKAAPAAAALVPANHSHLERALAAALEPLAGLDPAPMETLWDAWGCPAPFLPFLAYALSVDLWEEDWDENTQRQAIADSPAWHRLKGTRRAVEMAVALFGRPVIVQEWHETSPPGRRGTFALQVPLQPEEAAESVAPALERLHRLVASAKPKSRAFTLGLTREAGTGLSLACGVNAGLQVELAAPPDEMALMLCPAVGLVATQTQFFGVP